MAFKFFRRHQKKVIIVMAVLMVLFLVGLQGLESLTAPKEGDISRGQTRHGKITLADTLGAETDLSLLHHYVGLSFPRRMGQWPGSNGMEFIDVRANGDNANLTYAMLLAEADAVGVTVSDADVRNFFNRIGLSGADYEAMLSSLRSAQRGITEKRLRAAAGNWLRIFRAFESAQPANPPSEPELQTLYRDLGEMIDLRMLTVAADEFLEEVPEPAAARIADQFAGYKTRPRNEHTPENPFGFGYKQPNRVRIRYLFVSRDVVQRVTRPRGEQMRDYFRRHRDELVRQVPVASTQPASGPATQPASGPASQPAGEPELQPASEPATRPVEYRTVRMTYAEAKPKIVAKLTADAVRSKLDTMLGWLEGRVARAESSGAAVGGSVYDYVREQATLPATKALAVPVTVRISGQRLDRAMEMLAEAADLAAICYPWDTQGQVSVAPSVRVTLEADKMPLGEALDRIGEQVLLPPAAQPPEAGQDAPSPPRPAAKLRWAMCERFDGVLFPVDGPEGMKLFPLSTGDTGLVDFGELTENPLLRGSHTSPVRGRGRTLAMIARCAEPLERTEQMDVMIQTAQAGPRMYVHDVRPGRLLWKLAEAVGSHVPKKMTDAIRTRAADDLKLQAAFDLATRRAEELGAAAARAGLTAAAKGAKRETRLTGLFSRKTLLLRSRWGPLNALRGNLSAEEKVIGAQQIVLRGHLQGVELTPELVWNGVADLSLPTDALRRRFVTAAFKVAPKNVEPPYPASPPATAVVPVESDRSVVVIERVDFRPLLADEYGTQGRLILARYLTVLRARQSSTLWFRYDNVARRVGYKPPAPQ